jgi:hypothetical protein
VYGYPHPKTQAGPIGLGGMKEQTRTPDPMADETTTNAAPRSRAARARERASRAMSARVRGFYMADPRRRTSAERDFGLRWRSSTGATYRAAWIADTEELYSVRHSGADEDAEVTVLARVGADLLDCVLAGWRRICDSDQPGSYEWLVERAASARRAAAPAF